MYAKLVTHHVRPNILVGREPVDLIEANYFLPDLIWNGLVLRRESLLRLHIQPFYILSSSVDTLLRA